MSETKEVKVEAAAAASAVHVIDMRSDTVTQPTPEMRKAMFEAPVGDDVFGDDPTVNALQELAARILGKEAALFVSSGTQGNLLACLVHCKDRGSEMILGDKCHIHTSEGGGSAHLGGIHSRTVATRADGTLDLAEIKSKIRPVDDHCPVTRLICLENTHNRNGGRVLSAEYTDSVGALAKAHGLRFHIDGARLLNASVALGVSPARLVASADSVSVCLSKGLAAPIGSVLVGTRDFITHAKKLRKALGGGMRQVGVVAAAGILSLTTMVSRLADDHANLKSLAKQLAKLDGLTVDVAAAETNILFVELAESIRPLLNAQQLEAALNTPTSVEYGASGSRVVRIPALAYPPWQIRLMTHHHITAADIDVTVRRITDIIAAARAATPAAAPAASS